MVNNSPRKVGRIILIRHGESIWNTTDPMRNMQTRFTGWANIPLSDLGKEQAYAAGRCLLQFKLHTFDAVFTSLLDRSAITYDLIKKEIERTQDNSIINIGFKDPPITQSWRLNERHYGALIGLTKDDATKKYGRDAVRGWRLSWDLRPPPMTKHPFYYTFKWDSMKPNDTLNDWQSVIWTQALTRIKRTHHPDVITIEKGAKIPLAESVKDCAERVLPLWEKNIVPRLLEGQTVLVVAHSNTIRGMVKHIDSKTLSDENLKQVTIPSATPMIYSFELDDITGVRPAGQLSPLGVRGRFMVTPELLRLSLMASQHLEMSENLDNSDEFKIMLQKALSKLTEQVRVQRVEDGNSPDSLDDANERGKTVSDKEALLQSFAEEDGQLRALLDLRGQPSPARFVTEPGWMSLPVPSATHPAPASAESDQVR